MVQPSRVRLVPLSRLPISLCLARSGASRTWSGSPPHGRTLVQIGSVRAVRLSRWGDRYVRRPRQVLKSIRICAKTVSSRFT